MERGARRLLGRDPLRGRAARRPGLRTFSSAQERPCAAPTTVERHPEVMDPPRRREFRRLERLVHARGRVPLRGRHPPPRHPADRRLRRGRAVRVHGRLPAPLPASPFFERAAPPPRTWLVNDLATAASPRRTAPGRGVAGHGVLDRRPGRHPAGRGPRNDVVDAVLAAEIEAAHPDQGPRGRPAADLRRPGHHRRRSASS